MTKFHQNFIELHKLFNKITKALQKPSSGGAALQLGSGGAAFCNIKSLWFGGELIFVGWASRKSAKNQGKIKNERVKLDFL